MPKHANLGFSILHACALWLAFVLMFMVRTSLAQEIFVVPEQHLLGDGSALELHIVAANSRLDGALSEWRGRTADLVAADGRLEAQVWLAQHEDGIIMAGTALDNAHLTWQIRIASMPNLRLPPMGWARGPEDGLVALEACNTLPGGTEYLDNCPAWFSQQAAYRKQIASLFVRELTLNPSGIKLTHALPTFSAANYDNFRADLQSLSADISTSLSLETNVQNQAKYFELLIPWDALPATDQLSLKQLYLQVDICSPKPSKIACVPMARAAKPGAKVSATQRLVLAAPRAYRLSGCEQKLPEDSVFPSYFLPGSELEVDASITFTNPGGGYLDGPSPIRISPEIESTHFGTHFFADHEAICTPNLSYLFKGEVILPDIYGGGGIWQMGQSLFSDGFPIDNFKSLDANRTLFIEAYTVTAPRSGEGVNAACDRTSFSLWITNRKKMRFTQALELQDYSADLCAGSSMISAELSSDLKTVDSIHQQTVPSEQERVAWGLNPNGSTTVEVKYRYCLSDETDRYEECGLVARELKN